MTPYSSVEGNDTPGPSHSEKVGAFSSAPLWGHHQEAAPLQLEHRQSGEAPRGVETHPGREQTHVEPLQPWCGSPSPDLLGQLRRGVLHQLLQLIHKWPNLSLALRDWTRWEQGQRSHFEPSHTRPWRVGCPFEGVASPEMEETGADEWHGETFATDS